MLKKIQKIEHLLINTKMLNSKKFNVIGVKPLSATSFIIMAESEQNGYWPINEWFVTSDGIDFVVRGRNPEIDDVDILCDDYIDFLEHQYNVAKQFYRIRHS